MILYVFLAILIGGVVYIYSRKMIGRHLVPVSAEIDKIKIGYMSSASLDNIRTLPVRFFGKPEATVSRNAISIPEVLVQYHYYYNHIRYTDEKYVLLTDFLRDIPFQLDFNELGPDFPILILPGRRIVGEENIEDYLLNIQSDISVMVDDRNPGLSVLAEESPHQ